MGSGRAYAGRNTAQGHRAAVSVSKGGSGLTCLADAEKARLWMREAMNMIAVGADDDGSDRCRRGSRTTSGEMADVEGGDVGDGGRAKKRRCGAAPLTRRIQFAGPAPG